MTILNKLTGYDRRTERLEVELTLSAREFDAVRGIEQVPPEYEETLGSFALADDVARRIFLHLDRQGDVETHAWFLEPFARADA